MAGSAGPRLNYSLPAGGAPTGPLATAAQRGRPPKGRSCPRPESASLEAQRQDAQARSLLTGRAKLFWHSLVWSEFLKDSASACVRAPTFAGIPTAKSTGRPDRRFSTDGRHGGTASTTAKHPRPSSPRRRGARGARRVSRGAFCSARTCASTHQMPSIPTARFVLNQLAQRVLHIQDTDPAPEEQVKSVCQTLDMLH